MPKWFFAAAAIVVLLTLVPLALIARSRAVTSQQPRLHFVPDMDNQPKFRAQSANPMFADGRAMRPRVPGTVSLGDRGDDAVTVTGKAGEGWVAEIPVPVTMTLLRRGQERWGVFCAPCHGLAGYGDGMVGKRAEALAEGTWTPPSSLHTDLVRQRPVGHLYNTIANGIRTMPAYGPQIPVADRWAIVAFVRALQRSQSAGIDDVPAELRGQLR
jgi:mono/diheme cytochrome c family protein